MALAAFQGVPAAAQIRGEEPSATSAPASDPAVGSPAAESADTGAPPEDDGLTQVHGLGLVGATEEGASLWPELRGATLTWLGVLVVLLLTLQISPLLAVRNLDGLMIAVTALLLAFRHDYESVGAPGSTTRQSLAYSLLAVVLLYWFLRGFFTLRARMVPAATVNVSEGAMIVLLAAVLTVALSHIATGPLEAGARDGLIGGLCLAETGALPYGDAPGHDMHSPALYIINSAMVKAAPPAAVRPSGETAPLSWSNREQWRQGDWWRSLDKTPIRAMNALLLILTLLALLVIGTRLNSLPTGLTLVAIFAAFPGAMECFNRPDVMLPTMLLAWSLALALVPAGGLLAALFLVAAGLAWPWAWLALPVMLGYFIRQGWNGVGATAGLIAGVAVCIVGVSQLVQPALPTYRGAVGHSGENPTHVARVGEDGQLKIEPGRQAEAVEAGWSRLLWDRLLSADSATVNEVRVQHIVADEAAHEPVQQRYRATLKDLPETTRFWASLRTVLEYTWLPQNPAEKPQTSLAAAPETIEGAWDLWALETGDAGMWLYIRRGVKILAVAAALLFGVGLLRLRQPLVYKLTGAVGATLALGMLSTEMSAATHWAVILPALLAVYASHGVTREAGRAAGAAPGSQRGASPNVPSGAAPRVSVNN